MQCNSPDQPVSKGMSHRLVLVGNSNVGKSTVFHCLTGRYVTVANYPGTTVEVSRGVASLSDGEWEVVDTPGVNGLNPSSEEGTVTRNVLVNGDRPTVLQVIDAKNLKRGLLLTLQLSELGLPLVLVLNMADEASSRGIRIDRQRLQEILGVDVVSTVAVEKQGMEEVKKVIPRARAASWNPRYPQAVEDALREIAGAVHRTGANGRALGLLALCEGEVGAEVPGSQATDIFRSIYFELEKKLREGPGVAISRARLAEAERVAAAVLENPETMGRTWLARAGEISMHPLWGLPVLLAVLAAVYLFVGRFGAQTLVGLLENGLFGHVLSPLAIRAADLLFRFPHVHQLDGGALTAAYQTAAGSGLARFLHDFFVGEYGVVTMALSYAVAIVLPIVLTFFIAFGLLEDSGYLPRLAVMTDRIFRLMGLNGKAVLPMVLGLGCDTMATLTARILETRKERLLVTLLLALGVPCSAQLGVILGMLGALHWAATLVWGSVILISLLAVGLLASRLLPGEQGDFLLEIPPMRIPQVSNILKKTLARLEWYLREAVPLFVLGTIVLFFLAESGLLVVLERLAQPVVVGLLGLPARATEAFLIGFFRRDYGAAGLYHLFTTGILTPPQAVVSLVTITLFVPCVANFLIIVKEQGLKTAAVMATFIFSFAFGAGAITRLLLQIVHV